MSTHVSAVEPGVGLYNHSNAVIAQAIAECCAALTRSAAIHLTAYDHGNVGQAIDANGKLFMLLQPLQSLVDQVAVQHNVL